MKVDLHNHTPLCNHAIGSADEYVTAAINHNTEIFGFSDHAPMDYDPKYRMSFKQMDEYINSILDVKEKYKDQIEVLVGFEVDYFPNKMDKRVLEADVDYLIGSIHFIDEWGFDNPEFIGRYDREDIDAIWQRYFDLIEAMAKTKYFDIVGHLDLIKVFKFLPKNKKVTELAYSALVAIKEADMVLEINVAGYRKPIGEAYPSKELLEIAFSLDIPITFGSDAHEPEQVALYCDEVYALTKSVGYEQCATFRNRKRTMVNF